MFLCRFKHLTPRSKMVFRKKNTEKTRHFVKIDEQYYGNNAIDISTLELFHIEPETMCEAIGMLIVTSTNPI